MQEAVRHRVLIGQDGGRRAAVPAAGGAGADLTGLLRSRSPDGPRAELKARISARIEERLGLASLGLESTEIG